jgi:uncharacterized membrane protein
VVYVFEYPSYVTVKRSLIIVGTIWTFSIMFASVRFIISNPEQLPSLWITSLVLTFIFPLVVIVFCYAKILKEAHKQRRQISHHGAVNREDKPTENQQRESNLNRGNTSTSKANMTVGIVVGLFVVLWLPCLVTSLIHVSISSSCLKMKLRKVWLWADLLAFLSSAINPWIYAVRNSDFREAFRYKLGTFKICNR